MGSWGLGRISPDLSAAAKRESEATERKAPSKKISSFDPQSRNDNRKLHAGIYVHDEAYDIDQHDCGPWIGVNSTRIDSIRYDYQNRAVQVTWANKPRERGYVYLDVPYERFRSFIRAASKGKYVNRAMNSYEYRQMTPDELDAPTNDKRSRFGN
jgi:hypothetical protein